MSNLTSKEPDVSFEGLSIWVHGYQFPNIDEYWDANWLYCTARCTADGARVEATGSFLNAPELSAWLEQCDKLTKTLTGTATLKPMEPTLRVVITAKSLGHMDVQVELTADHLAQRHWFEFNLDQTYVVQLTSQLRSLLEKFPIRGK